MKTLVRGRILSFKRQPSSIHDLDSYIYMDDGFLLIEDQKIVDLKYPENLPKSWHDINYIDYRPHIIFPGFIDVHNHFPQLQVIASYGTQLMDWLKNYTFPEEAKFHSYDYAQEKAKLFLKTLVNNGTTSTVSFCSVHKESAEALFEEALKYKMSIIAGKVMMNRNAPDGVLDDAQSSYDDCKSLIKKWHRNERSRYAISPRFAITSTHEQLELAGALKNEFKDCFVQTHISENREEIKLALSLFPERKNYLDIYTHYGLVGPKSLLGHAIHLDACERAQLAEYNAVAVHCPTSNLFLGSGLFDLVDFKKRGVRTGIATDTGGGTSHSMLTTLASAYTIQQLRDYSINPLESFYWSTLGNAIALGLSNEIGSFKIGSFADFIVLDSCATNLSEIRMQSCESLLEELFILQTLGDERFVVSVYIAGKRQK